MGRIYRDDGPFGKLTIGQFGSEQVAGTSISYQEGKIFCYHLVNHYKIAECRDGIIYNAEGNIALARLHDGIIYDTNNKEIARYEGNVYGAAAATVAHILKIDASNYTDFNKEKNVSNPINNNPEKTSEQSSEDLNLLQTIIAILVFLPMLVITIIKYIFKAITFLIKLLTKPLFTIILIPTYWVVYVIWEILYAMNVPSEYDYSIKKVFTDIHIIVYMIISILSLIAAIILYKKTKEKTLNNHLVGGISFLQNAPWLANTFFNTCFFFNYVIHICGIYNNPERKNPLFIDILRIIRHYYYPDNTSAPKHILYSIGSGVHGMNTLINDLTFSFFVGYEEFFFIAIAVLLSFIYLLISRNKLKKKASIQTTETT